jgi:hypothetical protein
VGHKRTGEENSEKKKEHGVGRKERDIYLKNIILKIKKNHTRDFPSQISDRTT